MPLVGFVLLAVLCIALLGFACACLSDHPMQALERALAAIPAAPALIEVWSLALALAVAGAFAATRGMRTAPTPTALQRLLL
ncbi:MAG: hypothetical protein ACRDM9_08660 [Gaiellaceae bacterium]